MDSQLAVKSRIAETETDDSGKEDDDARAPTVDIFSLDEAVENEVKPKIAMKRKVTLISKRETTNESVKVPDRDFLITG